MGAGDDIMATGLARGARDRGKRIAFGDGQKIIWGPHSADIFSGNPNIAAPGSERDSDIEWVRYHKGHRIYNRQQSDRWIWNHDFSPTPGQIFFSDDEQRFAYSISPEIVLLEPNVPQGKNCTANKQWPVDRWQAVADALREKGFKTAQLEYSTMTHRLKGVELIHTRSFRRGVVALSEAMLLITHEGGLHHGAAAVGTPAVVIFGGWIPPDVTGYKNHKNISGLIEGEQYCGLLRPCEHCRRALARITVEQVVSTALEELRFHA